jgi:branched-chain amino acid aminotransferase
MTNYNGIFTNTIDTVSNNRAFLYGDAVFETIKVRNQKILFWEDHYFRLMATMRIVRMKIPMDFTPEFLETAILSLVEKKGLATAARVRLTVFRNPGGRYTPEDLSVSYLIEAEETTLNYNFLDKKYEVELYKDFYVSAQLLSTLKTTNKMIHITAGVFSKENGYENCLLLNEHKQVVEAINGNLFMLVGNTLITPPLTSGCLNGIMRKQVMSLVSKWNDFKVLEQEISTFDLQKADELFITNIITGLQPISKYRKKSFENTFAKKLVHAINAQIIL